MRRAIWYEAIDPYYSDQVQTFIGFTHEDLDEQQYDFEQYLGREHSAGISFIYKSHIIFESECCELESKIHEKNYKRFKAKQKTNQPTN